MDSAGDSLHLCGGLADIAVKTFKFRVVAVYAPNTSGERRSFYRRLEPFLDDSKRIILMGDWNAILDPKVDKDRRGARRLERCESSLIDFLAEFDLIDRYRLDHPGREMWTWMGNLPSGQVRMYLDRVLVRRADADFVSCATFHWLGMTDHSVSLRLVDRPCVASYWKFNTSLLEISFPAAPGSPLIQRALVGAVTGNKWWESLKFRIGDFVIKYAQPLQLDRAKIDSPGRWKVGGSLAGDLARLDLEREASERYKGFVVRNRLKRVSNEAVRCSAFMHQEELPRNSDRYIKFVKSSDGHVLRSNRTFPRSLCPLS